MKPLEIGPISIRRTAAGAVSLLLERDEDVACINLSDREAVKLAVALLRAIPDEMGREVFGTALAALVATGALGAAAAFERGAVEGESA